MLRYLIGGAVIAFVVLLIYGGAHWPDADAKGLLLSYRP